MSSPVQTLSWHVPWDLDLPTHVSKERLRRFSAPLKLQVTPLCESNHTNGAFQACATQVVGEFRSAQVTKV